MSKICTVKIKVDIKEVEVEFDLPDLDAPTDIYNDREERAIIIFRAALKRIVVDEHRKAEKERKRLGAPSLDTKHRNPHG